jgi:hypothetical protein
LMVYLLRIIIHLLKNNNKENAEHLIDNIYQLLNGI